MRAPPCRKKLPCRHIVVLFAGDCLDETFEMVVIRSENEQAALDFMMNDPSVKRNVMMAELHPMRVSIHGGG